MSGVGVDWVSMFRFQIFDVLTKEITNDIINTYMCIQVTQSIFTQTSEVYHESDSWKHGRSRLCPKGYVSKVLGVPYVSSM